jgi:hypothetical protein
METTKKIVKELFSEKYLSTDEYQDKFYLMKKIKDNFPELSEETIYHLIEKFNKQSIPPRKRSIFIKLFLDFLKENKTQKV